MAKKLWFAVSVILALALIGFVAADVYISGEISSLLTEAGSEAAVLAENWQELQNERLSTVFFAGVFFVVILIIVLKIGAEKKVPKGISQSEAIRIADELLAQYKENGVYVESKEEDGDEDIITEMEVPKMKAVRFEGNKVVVEWNAVPNATGYYVWRKKGDGEWCKVKKFKKPALRYEDYDIEAKVRYAYSIRSLYEAEGVWIASQRDHLGMDIYVAAVRKEKSAGEEA